MTSFAALVEAFSAILSLPACLDLCSASPQSVTQSNDSLDIIQSSPLWWSRCSLSVRWSQMWELRASILESVKYITDFCPEKWPAELFVSRSSRMPVQLFFESISLQYRGIYEVMEQQFSEGPSSNKFKASKRKSVAPVESDSIWRTSFWMCPLSGKWSQYKLY